MTVLVLLPGMDGTGALFKEFLDCLDKDIKPIVVSYPAQQPLNYQELENFAQNFLPKNEPFILLGESFSGPIAIALAAEKPAGLIGLVLCCTFARNPVPWFGGWKRCVNFLPVCSHLSWLLAPLCFGRHISTDLCRALKLALSNISGAVIRARIRSVLEVDYSQKLKSIQIPIMYLQASQDLIVNFSASRHVIELAQTVEVQVLCAPHLLLQVWPAEAAQLVEKFIIKCEQNRTE